ncbi:MAG: cytochrome c [Alphaproteobacteria bacterium]|nr:cytochrome c [Alphaproteobacteria bacterium]
MPRLSALALIAAVAMTAAARAADAPTGEEVAGRAIAETRCGACHATGPAGESPMAKAPPFRSLGKNYPVENLEEALAEGMVAGHPGMPDDPWDPADIAPFIAYLKSIQQP